MKIFRFLLLLTKASFSLRSLDKPKRPHKMLKTFGFLLLYLLFITNISADEGLSGFVEKALEGNINLERLENNVKGAHEGLPDILKIDESSITLSGNYGFTGNSNTTGTTTAAGFTLNVIVPILHNLQFSGGINNQGQGSLSLNYSPLSFDTQQFSAQTNYEQQVGQLEYNQRTTSAAIENAILSWNRETAYLDYYHQMYALKEQQWRNLIKEYDLGGATYQELQNGEDAYYGARRSYYNSQISIISTRQNLYSMLGPGAEHREIPLVTLDSLKTLIRLRDGLIEQLTNDTAISMGLKNSLLDLKNLQNQLENTLPIHPQVSLNAGTNTGFSSFTVTGSVTFSKSHINFETIEDLEREIDIKNREITVEEYRLELEREMFLKNIELAREIHSLDFAAGTAAETALKEAEFLYSQGELTSIELEEYKLGYILSQIRVYQSAVGLYQAQGQYLLLFW